MPRHLAEHELLDAMEGTAASEARRHVAQCVDCRSQLEAASGGLSLAQEAEVPEPSPFYWQAFRQQVGSRIEAARPARAWRAWLTPIGFLAAAAAVVAVVSLLPRASVVGPLPPSVVPATVALLPAWTPLPPTDEDAGLRVLKAVVPQEGVAATECDGLADCVVGLSDEESRAVADALRRELQGRSS